MEHFPTQRIVEKNKLKLRRFVQNQTKAENLCVEIPSCCSCSGSTKVLDARAALKNPWLRNLLRIFDGTLLRLALSVVKLTEQTRCVSRM